ncbi:MAG: thioredoxin fold domain-containing protein [Gammaproteobacteria bacterium]|nr:thioredoxin fold domain-containing protein [Gammaproteobacteria bacterium]
MSIGKSLLPAWRSLIALWLLGAGLIPAAGYGAEPARDTAGFFDQSFANLKEELQAARSEGKLGLVIMFDDEDCPWCQKMKATVLTQARVQDYYRKHFRVIHLDVKGDAPVTDVTGQEMAQKDFAFLRHRVRATPVFLFLDLDGKVVNRYTGASKDADEFLLLAEFVVSGAYQSGNFVAYKRQKLSGAAK